MTALLPWVLFALFATNAVMWGVVADSARLYRQDQAIYEVCRLPILGCMFALMMACGALWGVFA